MSQPRPFTSTPSLQNLQIAIARHGGENWTELTPDLRVKCKYSI